MERVLKYKGFQIELDLHDTQLFYAGGKGYYGPNYQFKAEGLAEMFKLIDNYAASNDGFKPFKMLFLPEHANYGTESDIVEITGIDTYGKFTYISEDGVQDTIADESEFVDIDIRNESVFNEIKTLLEAVDVIYGRIDVLKETYHRKTLADKREELGIVKSY